MKTVKIATTARPIAPGNQRLTLFRIQEILSEHRAMLIAGILTDIPTYVQFKFSTKVDATTQQRIKDQLLALSSAKVHLDRHPEIVQAIEENSHYRVPSRGFFQEIDTAIEAVINPTQLSLLGRA